MDNPKPKLEDLRIQRNEESGRGGLRLAVLAVAVLGVVGVGVFTWWLHRPRAVEARIAVARAVAGPGSERTVLNASGYVTARRSATVSSKITGKVVEVLIEEGMKVRADQLVARLDDTNVKTSLRLAEAQLESATNSLAETRVRIKEAEQELERQTGLIRNKIATQADYDHAEAAALALKAHLLQQQSDVTVAERQVTYWQQQLDDTLIRAPFAGIVTSKNAQPGEMISPVSAGGGFTRTGICTIVDMESLEIEIDVNESYINRVEAGQPVEATLDAYPDWRIPCKVIAIIPTADRQKSTVKVRVGFDKLDPRILPEMSVKVAFHQAGGATPRPTSLVSVPKSAVLQESDRDVVLVVQGGRVERRTVTVNSQSGEETLLGAGVAPGEKVLEQPQGVADGTQVKEQR